MFLINFSTPVGNMKFPPHFPTPVENMKFLSPLGNMKILFLKLDLFFCIKIIGLTGKVYSDQTIKFPITSSRGNNYVMVAYDHGSNAILSEPLK